MKIPRRIKRSTLYTWARNTKLGRKYLVAKGKVLKFDDISEYQNQAPALYLRERSKCMPVVGIVRSGTMFDDYVGKNSSWLFYERYLKNNNIRYEYYDIHASDWLDKAKELDIIMWHVNSTPSELYMAESKIYVLEKELKKMCFPSFHEVWQYEDKSRAAYLYETYGLPAIPTFSTNSYQEAMDFLEVMKFPVIAKTNTGAGSFGVRKIQSRTEAKRYIKTAFSSRGKKTIYPYARQKDYILFQEYISDATFDLRVKLVGNKAFGFYRYPEKGDYRASGAGNVEKKAIPEEALRIAVRVKDSLQSRRLGVDLLYSGEHNQYLIIEASLFNLERTSEELIVDGVPGYYDISDIENITFREGRFWIHELVMEEVVREWLAQHNT